MPTPAYSLPPDWGISPLLKDVPFATADDVLAIFPEWMRDGDSTVRDAIAAALLKAFALYVSDCADHAGTTNPVYSADAELDYLAIARGMARAEGESDATFRARQLNDDAIATPTAIMAAVKAIIAPFSATDPYYFETPDDEVFSGSSDLADDDGFYLDCAVDPINASWRQYAARKVRPPQHGLVWGEFRSADTRRTLGDLYLFEADGARDYTDAFNAWAHAAIAIPEFRLPGALSTTDAFIFSESLAEAAEAGGIDAIAEIWDEATLETYAAGGLDFGSEVYTLGGDGALVVETIDKLLTTRGAFPVAFHIMLDPAL